MIGRRQFFAAAMGFAMMDIGAAHAGEAFLVRRFGAPKTRVQGGTRSGNADTDVLVLVSEETALAAMSQPDLYWFLSEDFGLRIDLSITAVGAKKPILALTMKRGAEAGIHRLSLKDQAVGLEEGTEYVFAVNLVPDPTMRTAERWHAVPLPTSRTTASRPPVPLPRLAIGRTPSRWPTAKPVSHSSMR